MTRQTLEDAAVATAQSLLDSYPHGSFGSDKKLVLFNFARHIRAGMLALLLAERRAARAALVYQRVTTLVPPARGARPHSRFDGEPVLAALLGARDSTARALEVALCFAAGLALRGVAEAHRLAWLNLPAAYLWWGWL